MSDSSSDGARPRDQFSWDDVRVFAVVAQVKSLSKAAKHLKVTTGMVSRRLDELERALDVRLLTRGSTGVTLTSAGEDMLDRALSMQRFADSIEDVVRARDRRDEGMVVLRVPDGLGGYWIAPRLPSFLNENPKIQITLDCGTLTADMEVSHDILITADKTEANLGDVITPLATLHYVLVAAPEYLETYGTPTSLGHAASDHRSLKHIAQTYQRETWSPKATAVEALASFSVISNSSSAIMSAVVAGAGICTAPSLFCHLFPKLQIVGAPTSFPIQLWTVVRREALASGRVQRVLRWLVAQFDTKTNPWFRDEFVSPHLFDQELQKLHHRLAPREEIPTSKVRRRMKP